MGMVYEPYLALTPHEDIFTRRLLRGDYFAEAAYASETGAFLDADRGGRSALPARFCSARYGHRGSESRIRRMTTGFSCKRSSAKCPRRIRFQCTPESLVGELDVPGAGPVAEEGLGDLLEKLGGPSAELDPWREGLPEGAGGRDGAVDRIRVGVKAGAVLQQSRPGRPAPKPGWTTCGIFSPTTRNALASPITLVPTSASRNAPDRIRSSPRRPCSRPRPAELHTYRNAEADPFDLRRAGYGELRFQGTSTGAE